MNNSHIEMIHFTASHSAIILLFQQFMNQNIKASSEHSSDDFWYSSNLDFLRDLAYFVLIENEWSFLQHPSNPSNWFNFSFTSHHLFWFCFTFKFSFLQLLCSFQLFFCFFRDLYSYSANLLFCASILTFASFISLLKFVFLAFSDNFSCFQPNSPGNFSYLQPKSANVPLLHLCSRIDSAFFQKFCIYLHTNLSFFFLPILKQIANCLYIFVPQNLSALSIHIVFLRKMHILLTIGVS